MGAPSTIKQSVLDEIKARVSIVALIGRTVKLQRAGPAKKGLCPFHSEKTPSFTVSDDRGTYRCFGCGAHGDVFRWVMEHEGVTFPEAVKRLDTGGLANAPTKIAQKESEREAPGSADMVSPIEAGRWIWRNVVPARGTIVEAWLRFRGCDPEAAFLPGAPALDRLRFHPRCPAGVWRRTSGPARHWLTAPAMVAPIIDPAGAVRGVHVTYLAADGRGKAAFPVKRDGKARETRKMFGRAGGMAVWLAGPGGGDWAGKRPPLVAGEGIETSWSYAQDFDPPCRVAAALYLDNLSGREKRLRDGSTPLWRPILDPGRACFTIPDPGDVILLVDADMKPLREQKVQLSRGAKPIVADINALQRAQLCADLGSQAWRLAGAESVVAVRPPMGLDFNDVAMGRAA